MRTVLGRVVVGAAREEEDLDRRLVGGLPTRRLVLGCSQLLGVRLATAAIGRGQDWLLVDELRARLQVLQGGCHDPDAMLLLFGEG